MNYRKKGTIKAFRYGTDSTPDWATGITESDTITEEVPETKDVEETDAEGKKRIVKKTTLVMRTRKVPVHAVIPVKGGGVFRAQKGDYIVQGLKGEIYPCKAEVFEAMHERVEGAPA